MKKYKYYSLIITRNDDTVFRNPLRLSEIKLLPQILRENKKVEIKICTTDKHIFENIFLIGNF